ncbi:MAG: pelota family protein [Nitrososphaerota archaeon]|nr:pelota family protein [Nitrososphaerota archaeon]
MLFKRIDGGKALSITPQSSADLWRIRRIIRVGDMLEAWTTREIKQEGDYMRPDKGRRVSLRIRLAVEQIGYDSQLDRLRVRGKIMDASNEMTKHGSYHSIEITPLSEFSLYRDDFPDWVFSALKSERDAVPCVIAAVDAREAGVGVLTGLSLATYCTVRSGMSGKLYPQDSSKLMRQYLAHASDMVMEAYAKDPASRVAVLGPGNTKNQLANVLREKEVRATVLEGFDLSGEDGVRLALNSSVFKEFLGGTAFARVSSFIDEVTTRLAKDDGRLAMGFAECAGAARQRSVQTLLVSDALFGSVDEQGLVDLSNEAEAGGAEVVMLDSSTPLGSQVSRMGGAVALLRYPMR